MKKNTWFVLSVIALAVVLGMPGYGYSSPAKKPIEITFPIRLAPETVEVMAANEFKRLVEERSKGRFRVNVFPGGVLGGERDNIEQIQLNEAQITNIGDLLPTLLAPTFAAPTVPFIFPDIKTVRAYWDGKVGQQKRAVIEASGVVVVGLQERLPRHLTSRRPIHTVSLSPLSRQK
jgi:TRAP-type C4-dicarboxylate transport system substrate-binding protein